ncbi:MULTISPECIES: histidinol-phosphate transaminase [unclassified Saccharibacter]|uniref:histidinol-phosphate transaminase n=1 Tax=unclassified Saccharibacter TaxID=2648722 RepID=UPI00132B132A|nr:MULTISPECIES: histidinol-phosphate transaminase [unclassified Saccharibacter]MXV35196.1 histidinol-phosphate transaminase [Saccharibacter sp. EH611]MXV57257.1 histidinol-phosphate transaminase [Saccharibacter sp. EH70]MXV64882.1 histidinol-phosphate transaminase [Saccharibacter sp. EH60]
MSRLWNPSVHALQPYTPGEQPKLTNLTKLNTNESPYGPSPKAIQAIKDAASGTLRLYPDPTSQGLRQAIAELYNVGVENIFPGNGSDEVLAHVFRALFHPDEPVLFSDVTYGFYPIYCQMFDLPYRMIPLREDFSIHQEDYTGPCGGIILANPNANTGMLLPVEDIEALVQRHPNRTVVVDEAYVEFGGQSAIPLIKRYDNLLIVRTFSKSSGLAGLRVGYAIGSEELIDGLTRVKDSFNSYPLSRPAQAGAEASIRDTAWLEDTTRKIIKTRDALIADLRQRGLTVLPSYANFILAHHPQHDAGKLAKALRDQAIIVRYQGSSPRIKDWLRITIGTDHDSKRLLEALDLIEKNTLR